MVFELKELLSMIVELEIDKNTIPCPDTIDEFFSIYPEKAKIKKVEIPFGEEIKKFETGGTVSCKIKKWETGSYKIKHRAEIKDIFLDETYGIFAATVKEKDKEKIFIDLTDEKEIVGVVGNKLAKDGEKYWAVTRRDNKTITDFKIDAETEYTYSRFFDKTKDKPDYFLYTTEEEAEKYVIEKSQSLSLYDLKTEIEKNNSDTLKDIYDKLYEKVVRKINKERNKKTTVVNTYSEY